MLLKRRIEEEALNAWPALQQILFDGWILRFSEGYTKRGNSVNPIFASSMDVDEKIDACERLYAERGLPTIFRLTPFSSPASLDETRVRPAQVGAGRGRFARVSASGEQQRAGPATVRQFGFQEAYPYWYRVLVAENTDSRTTTD